ncbi:putative enoyl-CoA hydratase [Amphiura filiformis]|uniref:putative enoyl-CoA hydratase n=1 Tax=Amphiura filiformis TaxID=82378 RepID=UPI003B21B9A1
MASHIVRYINDIAVLVLNDGKNRFNLTSINAKMDAVNSIERNVNAKALVITGTGTFFSMGLDLEWLVKQDEGTTREFFQAWTRLDNKLATFPLPTIAAINGFALGGGAFLALLCDKRIMRTQKGWICTPAIHYNFQLPPHLLEIVRIKVQSPKVLRDLVLFGNEINAVDALNAGLVDEIVDESLLLQKARQMATDTLGE